MNLLVTEEKRVSTKCFRTETRGSLDVKHLLDNAIVIGNEESSTLDDILRNILSQMLANDRLISIYDCIRVLIDSDSCEPRLRRRIQANEVNTEGSKIRSNWLATFATVDGLSHRRIGLSRLFTPTNLGEGLEEISLILVVLGPAKEKETKSAFETARTFSTLLTNDLVRLDLQHAADGSMIKNILRGAATSTVNSESDCSLKIVNDTEPTMNEFRIGSGILGDLKRRLKCYTSDWTDICFLLCTILPITIAYGMLNDGNTKGLVNVQKVILGQAIGGVFFAIFGGQPMLILSTSAPLSIYINVIYHISLSTDWPFYNLYVCVGLWCQVFLITAALCQATDLLQYTRRSTEEMFSVFIATALTYKSIRAMALSYATNNAGCPASNASSIVAQSIDNFQSINNSPSIDNCSPEIALLFILLTLLTFWLSTTLDSFRNTPFLSRVLRNLMSDYALPLAILIMAVVAHSLFHNIPQDTFNLYSTPDIFFTEFWSLPLFAHIICIILAVPLSVLFFVDQLLVTKTIDNGSNKLRKGSAYHWDLLSVAILNIFLSLACLPWMHGALPQSFLHLRSLADVEERAHDGRDYSIVSPREARLAVTVAHLLIGLAYSHALPFISENVPTSLFQGLFIFMAMSCLATNQFFHRILLIFTEQRAYPPTSYIRRVPQRIVHSFTLVQLIQLIVLLLIGLSPLYFISMLFPLIIASFVPVRMYILPRLFSTDHLEAIDGAH